MYQLPKSVTPSWSGKSNTMRNSNGSAGLKIMVVTIALVLIVGIVTATWAVKTSNKEKGLTNKMEAQEQVIEAFFDKMWKILKQQAGVTDEYKNSFGKIYKDLMAGRYSGEKKGEMMLWVKEHNPQFDTKLFDKLMISIEAQREGFFVEQKKIIAMVNEQKNLIEFFPSSMIVGDREIYKYEVISSAKAKEVMKTRQENDVDLFNKKKE